MLNRILAACLAAGALAGLATATLQEFTTTPLIIQAEAYEKPSAGGHQHSSMPLHGEHGARLILAQNTEAPAAPSPAAEAEEWAPADGIERTIYTSIATIVASFGFALILLSAMILTNSPITARTGLAWGAAAFVVTGLAPALVQ
jgi:predicted cobalt transporter CbtA